MMETQESPGKSLWIKVVWIDCETTPVVSQLNNVNYGDSVESLYPLILGSDKDFKSFDITCLMDGEILDSKRSLSEYNADTNSLLLFLIKMAGNFSSAAVGDKISLPRTAICLRYLVQKNLLSELTGIISDEQWLLKTDPSLRDDYLAYSLARDANLMRTIFKDNNLLNLTLEQHPRLLNILHHAVCAVGANAKQAVCGSMTSSSSQTDATVRNLGADFTASDYSIDQNELDLDEEEEMDETGDATPPTTRSGAVPTDERQFFAALTQAMQTASNQQPANSNPAERPNPNTPGRYVTAEVLSQAISAAAAVTNPVTRPAAVEASVAAVSQRWEHEVQQLIDMGITDEAVAIQALEASNGDVALAIQLLFG